MVIYDYFPNILTHEQCGKVTESLQFNKLTNSYTNGRSNSYALPNPNGIAMNTLSNCIQLLEKWYHPLRIESYGEDYKHIMIFQYNVGDHFNMFHIDINEKGGNDNNHSLNRVKTVVLQLSDPHQYVGGVFELKNVNSDFSQQGSMIVFNSNHPHRVTPIIEGCRCSMVLWLVKNG